MQLYVQLLLLVYVAINVLWMQREVKNFTHIAYTSTYSHEHK